ncbi:hypothetical protein [uncultured Methanobrevibacter sp.]|uniref:hypothetical protein n=1 Tax=uncultured Methanobrevibacter sp. TaxID=253161 RepID=UPI002603D5CE|nr:hypothetical protein [uncultured Methanobrevibacter sp.]
MAKPIASTPRFDERDVGDLKKYMKRPLTQEEKKFNERVKNAKKFLDLINLGDFYFFNVLYMNIDVVSSR